MSAISAGPSGRHPSRSWVSALDSMDLSPAYVMTSTWDIVAWNRAASAVLADDGALATGHRNLLRLIFCDPHVRARQPDWESVARFAVAAFRAHAARAGAARNVQALVDDLSRLSPEFEALWRDNDVRGTSFEGAKYVRHPLAGLIALEYSAFAVDGRPDLVMVIYTPATPADADRIRSLVKPQTAASTIPLQSVYSPGVRVEEPTSSRRSG